MPLPQILGILNVTPDSFSDGGRFADAQAALDAGRRMVDAGAAMVDVGGESTRPGASPVTVDEERRRVLPVIERLVAAGVPVSVDTRRAAIMRDALAAGAGMINDVSALTHDPDALDVVTGADCRVVLMHMRGVPATMQSLACYDNVVAEVRAHLAGRVDACIAAGIARERIILDPGIGFAKMLDHNLSLLRALPTLGKPLMLGASRKRMIAAIHPAAEPPDARLPGSLALALHGAACGVAWLRVHDVAETMQALEVWQRLQR